MRRVKVYAPDVDPTRLLYLGATELRGAFVGDEQQGVLRAYMDGLKVAFAVAIALLGLGFVISFVPKWNTFRPGQSANDNLAGAEEHKGTAVETS